MWNWRYTTKEQCHEFLLSFHLLDCKDSKESIKKLYITSNNIKKNYNIYHIKKRNGQLRTIYAPKPLLKCIQKRILENILNHKEISKYAKSYHKGLSLSDNANPHIGKKMILKLDIKNFFESISFWNVYNSCFPIEIFPKQIGMLLTYLCTYNDHLTQGSPTSAYISNLVMKEFDEYIGKYCEEKNISYTRYSDDMTFSGDFEPKEIINKVRRSLYKLDLELNDEKIHIINKSARQTVTGLVVNEKVQVSSNYRRKIRQEVYYIKKYGVESHLKRLNLDITTLKYLNKLYGKILFVLQINKTDQEFQTYKNYINQLIKNN